MEYWSCGAMASNRAILRDGVWRRACPEGTAGLSPGFQPWVHTQQKRTALKWRQVWNCQKPDMIPIGD